MPSNSQWIDKRPASPKCLTAAIIDRHFKSISWIRYRAREMAPDKTQQDIISEVASRVEVAKINFEQVCKIVP